MTYSYRVHTFKFVVSVCTFAVLLFLCILSISMYQWLLAAILCIFMIIFGFIAVKYGAVLTIDGDGIKRKFFGIPLTGMKWSEVAEVGVVGLKVFNNNNPKHTGNRYIYFSPRKLTEDERFALALKWPPEDMLYMFFTQDRANAVQTLWSNKIETYNAGNIFF